MMVNYYNYIIFRIIKSEVIIEGGKMLETKIIILLNQNELILP